MKKEMKKLNTDGWFLAEESFYIQVLKHRHIGYGRMMQIISEHWRLQDPSGALSLGECYGLLKKHRRK